MSLDVQEEPEALQSLPRGRHNLPSHVVRASQRERLLRAMLASVALRGYEATTVPGVVAEAHVSRNAFYELFSDKTDCFLALCDELAGEILAEVSATTETEWVAALRAGMARYLGWWADHPAFSRTYFVELPSAGQRAIAQREGQIERFRALFEQIAGWARTQQPDLPPLRPLAVRTVVVAVTELIAEEVRADRVEELIALEDELVFLCVMLLGDEATAREDAAS